MNKIAHLLYRAGQPFWYAFGGRWICPWCVSTDAPPSFMDVITHRNRLKDDVHETWWRNAWSDKVVDSSLAMQLNEVGSWWHRKAHKDTAPSACDECPECQRLDKIEYEGSQTP